MTWGVKPSISAQPRASGVFKTSKSVKTSLMGWGAGIRP